MHTALSPALSGQPAKPSRNGRITAPSSSQKQRAPTMRLRFDQQNSLDVGKYSREPEPNVVHAIQGNHLAIQTFLQRQLHRPSRAEFSSANLRPDYQPSERLIIKSPIDQTLIAHVQLEPQTIGFGHVEIPISRFRDLAVLPEFRHRGFGDRMLLEAEAEAKRSGAMLMVARGEDYKLLKKHGWSTLGSDPVSIASPQRFLGQLPAPKEPESPFYASRMPTSEVRIGRLTDVDDLFALHQQDQARAYGPVVRTKERWAWLMSKQSHDRIYLFIENDVTMAYIVVSGSSIVELVDTTDDGRGSARMLENVGADAIDQGRHTLRIHCPIDNRVHQWADLAGGQVFASATEDAWMVKVLSYRTLLRRLAPEIYKRRPRATNELSIRIGGEELLIKPGARSMKVTRGSSSKQRIGLTNRAAVQLFLGYRSASELAEKNELVASCDQALKTAEKVFPAQMLWRSRWDDMPVRNA